jgi:ATP-dependent RNA helicase DeaD
MEETQAPEDVTPAASPVEPPRSFAEMNLDPAVQQALTEMGFEVPMEVQTAIYGKCVAGKDLIVQSRTGSGKTAAFGIPIAQLLSPDVGGPQALILTPTRELALQVAQELGRICAYRNLPVTPIYGGAPMGRQIEALRAGAQVIAGTPGRLLDHMRRGTLKTSSIRFLVLDECDEMLSMGFLEDIEKIISQLPPRDARQTMLFSATVPEDIERISRRYMREPEKVSLSADFIGVNEIRHRYYLVTGMNRTGDLLRVLDFEQPESALIFCNTRDDTATVAGFLSTHGYVAEAISSDLTQADRERVMGLMRAKTLKFLVATDIAARGIDISDLSHVFNYTFPESPEVYIHRTGRTGRAGKQGIAISLIGPRELGSFYYLKLLYKIRPEERELPSEAELQTRREAERWAKVTENVPEEPGDEWHSLARRVWQSGDGERIVAALLRRAIESPQPAPAVAAAAPAPRTSYPERRERDDRPRERSGDRDRGPRDRGGDRGPRSSGDRDRLRARPERGRGERSDRDRGRDRPRPPRLEGGPASETTLPAAEGAAPAPAVPQGDREFWEAWADEKGPRPDGQQAPSAEGEPRPVEAQAAVPEAAPRPRRPREELPPEQPGFTRLYVNVGKREGIEATDLQGLIAAEAPDFAAAVARVLIFGTHTYLSVAEDRVEGLMAALRGKKLGDRELVIEPAKR